MNKLQALFIVLLCSAACFTYAQKPSRIGYVDMNYILSHLEDYKVASQQFALQVEQWEAEIAKRQEKIKAEKEKLEAEKALLSSLSKIKKKK